VHGHAQVERCVVGGMKPYLTHAQATRRPEPKNQLKAFMRIAGEAVCLLIACGAFYAVLVLAAILETPPPEPETRCFDTAVKSERYCRTQNTWSIE